MMVWELVRLAPTFALLRSDPLRPDFRATPVRRPVAAWFDLRKLGTWPGAKKCFGSDRFDWVRLGSDRFGEGPAKSKGQADSHPLLRGSWGVGCRSYVCDR